MKKSGLFKIIMFILFAIVILTWLIPAGYYNSGELVDLGMNQLGFFDFWQLLFASFGASDFGYFVQILMFLLSVGALYGVLGKTGKYRAAIEKIANKFKGNELHFIVIVAVLIAVLTSVFSYELWLFIFIPALISIILLLGYDKVTACVATFGAMLIGNIGSTIGYNMVGAIQESLKISKLSNGIYYRLGILVFSLGALVFYLYKAKRTNIKKDEEKAIETEDLFAGESKANKYSVVPIIVIFAILFVLLVLGCTAWEATFNVKIFTTLNNKITSFAIGKDKFTIFGKLLGNVSAFGSWHYAEMAVMCTLSALLLGRFYRMSHKETIDNMIDGTKKILNSAVLVILSYTVVYFACNTMTYPTIADFILKATSKFNIFFSTITMILGSVLHVDMLYVVNYVIPQIAGQNVSTTVMALLAQGIYGVTMFAAPTSVALVLGLSYLGIPYKEWLKRTWKLLVALLAIVMVAIILAMVI